ncbi:MAG TPA: YaiO family outer membrane beta-barrel protein [Gemmatimonas sp.]|nr:YaiO family outer membrane beta-barrel protein [Gemmatimonas sp.]
MRPDLRSRRGSTSIGGVLAIALARAFAGAFAGAFVCATVLPAQAPLAGGIPGGWVEANALYQSVSNGFGDWQGAYLRAVRPSARDTWWADVLALEAFTERGTQVGITQRHDWSPRVFQMIGASVGSGASIMPRVRADGTVGVRLGDRRQWQTSVGASYVKSVSELSDVAGIASVAWYAPHALMLETGVRYNVSRPGNIRSHRLINSASWTPTPRRTLSARVIAGSEGWQTLRSGTTLVSFHSQEYALAWRQLVAGPVALSLQGDFYRNPFYTRSGVTLGVARYW